MIDWNLSDEQMREVVMQTLTGARDEMVRQAERNEARAGDRSKAWRDRRESEACARYSRRQAAHYQQAIDLVLKAEMPGAVPDLAGRIGALVQEYAGRWLLADCYEATILNAVMAELKEAHRDALMGAPVSFRVECLRKAAHGRWVMWRATVLRAADELEAIIREHGAAAGKEESQ